MTSTHIIELYGAPNTGKTSMAHMAVGIMLIKFPHIRVAHVPEMAKHYAYTGDHRPFHYQQILVGQQMDAISALLGKVDVIITDGPIETACYYSNDRYSPAFYDAIRESANFAQPDVTIHRHPILMHPSHSINHQMDGRIHDVDASNILADRIETYMDTYHPHHQKLDTPSLASVMRMIAPIRALFPTPN